MELEILDNGMDGEGIAKQQGKVFFVEGAISGEVVEVLPYQENKSFCKAKLLQVVRESKFRVLPKCKYYDICGGCSLQHMCNEYQIKIKTNNIKSLLKKSNLDISVNDCIKSEKQFGYRNKITLYYKNGNLGFYQKKSKNVVQINQCLLVDNEFNNLINVLNNFCKNNRQFAFVLKGITIRQINNIYLINLILSKKINTDKLENYLILNKINYSLYYCVNNKNDLPNYPCIFIGGKEKVYLSEFDINYLIYPMSFLQVNNYVKKQIYNEILKNINVDEVVIDAYSGAGLLSAIISKKSKYVYAVEIDKSASQSCENLIKENNIKNLKSICGDCNIEIKKLLKNNPDCIVLDPARKGVEKDILDAISQAKTKKIVYLSCNPATLIRDIKVLNSYGYDIKFVQPYDMFPNTSEVETLVVLEYKN